MDEEMTRRVCVRVRLNGVSTVICSNKLGSITTVDNNAGRMYMIAD